ncbi:MAG: hypothetical protein ACOH1Y_10755 [Propionicimonas sp.]
MTDYSTTYVAGRELIPKPLPSTAECPTGDTVRCHGNDRICREWCVLGEVDRIVIQIAQKVQVKPSGANLGEELGRPRVKPNIRYCRRVGGTGFAAGRPADRQDGPMRIGTWNLAGRWSPQHLELLGAQECDVWLLTELRTGVSLPGYESHVTAGTMAIRRHWAGILCLGELQPMPDPHPASAAALAFGQYWCSSILPWRSCGSAPWGEGTSSEKTRRALDQLIGSFPDTGLVWGGDWNHALHGREYTGSVAGRTAINAALVDLRLKVPTEYLPHRIPDVLSIDHIAVPESAKIHSTTRIIAQDAAGNRLSDHDAYSTEVRLA